MRTYLLLFALLLCSGAVFADSHDGASDDGMMMAFTDAGVAALD